MSGEILGLPLNSGLGRRSSHTSQDGPILQGWLARESAVVSQLLNKRYGALHASKFVTYRKDTDDSPSKVWQLSPDTIVGEVKQQEYHVRHARTSTLWAVATKAYDSQKMWAFQATWPRSGILIPDELVLAFEKESEARTWRDAFADAASSAELPPRPSARSESAPDSATASPRKQSELGRRDPEAEATARTASAEGGSGSPPPSRPDPPVTRPIPASRPGSRQGRAWASVMHINGVAVYVEERDAEGGGGAIMASAVVRAPPARVARQIIARRSTPGLGALWGARTLAELDACTSVVSQTWRGAGLVGAACAPRELVLLKTWRRDPGGSYIVLYQSTELGREAQGFGGGEEPSARGGTGGVGSWLRWRSPVRAQVAAGGFTVAPLLPEYHTEGASREALLTLVLKADLGGALGDRAAWLRAPGLGALAAAAQRALLEPMVLSLVVLRDQVEQDRFVLRPLSREDDGDVDDAQVPPPGAAAALLSQKSVAWPGVGTERARSLVRRGLVSRSATNLTYSAVEEARLESLRRDEGREDEGRVQGEVPLARSPCSSPLASALSSSAMSADSARSEEEGDWAGEGSCRREFWSSPGNGGFDVRGPLYLQDRRKIKAGPPMFELVAVDLLKLDEPMPHVARLLPSVQRSQAPFLFVVQLMVPCVPQISLTCVWAAPFAVLGQTAEDMFEACRAAGAAQGLGAGDSEALLPFLKSLHAFLQGDGPEADAARSKVFKLIPHIARGSWIIQKSVGTTPTLLGQKLTTKYFRGPHYFEVDVDIASSSVAASITNMVAGATKSLVIDLGILIEGQREETLPEALLGTLRLKALDLKTAAYLDETTGKIVPRSDL